MWWETDSLVECLDRQPQDDDTRIEAAHVISSISYGSQEALRSLLRADALQAFLYAISNFRPNDSMALKAAFARALRALAVAISDAVGPSVWGLRSGKSDVRYEAMTALDCLFQVRTNTPCVYIDAERIRVAGILGYLPPAPHRCLHANEHIHRPTPSFCHPNSGTQINRRRLASFSWSDKRSERQEGMGETRYNQWEGAW